MPFASRSPTSRDAARLFWFVGALVLAGCNSIFGLDPVRRLTEPLPDAGADGGAAGAAPAGATGGSGGAGGSADTGAGGDAVTGAGGSAVTGAGGAVTGAGGAASCTPIALRNGSFDEGTTGWITVPDTQVDIRRDDDAEVSTTQMVTPHSGRYLARLGGPSRYLVTWLEQSVLIPADARELTVSGFVLIKTDEDPDMAYDMAKITIGDEVDYARPLIAWSNLTAAPGWTEFRGSANVADLAGQTLAFRLYARLDENTASYFFFDTVSLAVTGCGP